MERHSLFCPSTEGTTTADVAPNFSASYSSPTTLTPLGHELAHANLDHLNKRRANAVIGWIGGVAADAGIMLGGMSTYGAFSRVLTQAGARAFSVAFEREADYVGAYMPPVPATTLPVRRNLTHILAGEP